MKRPSLMDREFKYTNAAETDLHKTFARIRKQLKEAEKPQPANVRPLRTKGAA